MQKETPAATADQAPMSAGRILGLFIVGGLALVLPESVPATNPTTRDFRVVVHASRPAIPLSRAELAGLFLAGTSDRWPDGREVVPVDQPPTSPVREAFSRDVLRQPVEKVLDRWQRQVRDSGLAPPLLRSSDAEVLATISADPRAIGYVSQAAVLDEGVRALELQD